MSTALRRPMTTEEFLDWEERQELRFEFDGEAAVAMVGGTYAHSTIQANLMIALGVGLRGGPCRPHGDGLRVRIPSGQIRYPDALVVCAPVPPGATAIDHPVVLFEIVSESSSNRDFSVKNAEYRSLPALRRYVVLQQRRAAAAVFARAGETWMNDLLVGLDAVLRMPEIGLELSLAEIYADVAFEADADRDDAGG